MEKNKRVFWLVAVLMALAAADVAAAQDPAEIIRRMEDVMRGDSSHVEMTMTIERPRYTRDVSMRVWAKGEDYALILITAPARDRGTAFLKREGEIWNYVPTIDRTIKMPPSMLAQPWMGSDFTNDDLVRESSVVDDYEHRLLSAEAVEGRQSYVVEMIPKPDAPVVWGKVHVWVSVDDYLQLRVEHFDQRGNLVNTIAFDRIREMGGRIVPTRMTLTPAGRPNQRTVLTYESMEFNIDIDESFFTQQNMRRAR